MKKCFLALLFGIIFSAVAFAENNTSGLLLKVGMAVQPNISLKSNGISGSMSSDGKMGSAFVFAGEYFNCVTPTFEIGGGISNIFDSKDTESDAKIGFTNIYLSLKPKIYLNKENTEPIFLYFLGQIGAGLVRHNINEALGGLPPNVASKTDNGFYWGIGTGLEIKSFFFEILYSTNYFNYKFYNIFDPSLSQNFDFTFSAINLNIGYKFIL